MQFKNVRLILVLVTAGILCGGQAFAQSRDRDHDQAAHANTPPAHYAAKQSRTYSTPQHRSVGRVHTQSTHTYAAPHVHGVLATPGAVHNYAFHHTRSANWRPRYNFYNHQYHMYPYVYVSPTVELSSGYVPVDVSGTTYYYDQGNFYQQDPQGYEAIAPPIGAIVAALPPGSTSTIINGMTYFIYNGVYYQEVQGGYQVVEIQ